MSSKKSSKKSTDGDAKKKPAKSPKESSAKGSARKASPSSKSSKSGAHEDKPAAGLGTEHDQLPDFGHPGLHTPSNPFGGMHPNPSGFVGQPPEQSKVCYYHGQPLRFYCDNSEEPICYDCTVMGPHNTQLTRISSLEDAFRARYDIIYRAITKTLIPKRQQLIA